jgi:hypothetical protein
LLAIRQRNATLLLDYAEACKRNPDQSISPPELEPLVKVHVIAKQYREEYRALKAQAEIDGPEGDTAREELEKYKADVEGKRQELKVATKDGKAVVHDMNSVWSRTQTIVSPLLHYS